jgi:ribonuclease E
MKIDIITDRNLIIPEYIIDFKNKSKKTIELIERFEKLRNLEQQKKQDNVIDLKVKKKYVKKTFRKKKFFKKAK